MRKLRACIPFLGILALMALFFKLPESPNLFGVFGCKTCSVNDPYLPIVGAGYFALLIALSLAFPKFPGPKTARAGLTWAFFLALTLIYIDYPKWCVACLIAHACNLLIWLVWVLVPAEPHKFRSATHSARWGLVLFGPISVVAMFSSLNATFMTYDFKFKAAATYQTLRQGDTLPIFSAQTISGRKVTQKDVLHTTKTIFNFISPACVHCKDQLQVVNAVALQLNDRTYRFINIGQVLPSNLNAFASGTEWIEDKDGKLGELFKVAGYPTMFIVGSDGKISQIILGVPEELKTNLISSLINPKKNPAAKITD